MDPFSIFSLAKAGGSLLGNLFGSSGDEKLNQVNNPYTQKADQQNDQQRLLNKQLYQQDLSMAGRNANRLVNNTAIQSMGAQAQTGMADNATTNALLGMSTGNLGRDLLDQGAAATGRYADNMAKSTQLTSNLHEGLENRWQSQGPNVADKLGQTVGNLGKMVNDSATETEVLGQTRNGRQKGYLDTLFGTGRG
jgi:hypothetical protein